LPTLEEVKGQIHGKRALEIASAGGHNLINICNKYTTPKIIYLCNNKLYLYERKVRCYFSTSKYFNSKL